VLINQAADGIRRRGHGCEVFSRDESHGKLLEKSRFSPDRQDAQERKYPLFLIVPNAVGRRACERITLIGHFIGFVGNFLLDIGVLVLRPQRMRWTSLIFHMEQTGIRAVPIVSLLSFLIGMVVAYMGMEQLDKFGARIFAVRLLEVTVLREMAVLITAIVVAGRSSSSFTAQIGAMVANEEIAAMLSMGLDPILLLVVPRVFALMLCLPMLVFVADISALVGGGIALWFVGSMDPQAFMAELYNTMNVLNFFVGIAKTPFFAMAIGLVGCFQGFRATSSAESVGLLTTVSVVEAIFIVILLNAVFAIFFAAIGI
jgi:phospholipid/cholesterol/gamma-HCH transport system permease protein